jgi:hypothetical protein
MIFKLFRVFFFTILKRLKLTVRNIAHFSDKSDAGKHDAMMLVVEQRRDKLDEVVDQLRLLPDDPARAESRFLFQISGPVSHYSLHIRRQIARHFGRADVSQSAQSQRNDVLRRVL